MFGFNPTNLAIGALMLVAAFVSGGATDHFYGPNAWWKANRQAEDRAKNAVLTDLIENDRTVVADEDDRFARADAEFAKVRPTLTQCLLTATDAAELSKVAE